MRSGIVKALGKILIDPETSPREKTAAARALMAADAQNIEIEKMEQADEHEHRARLVAIAKHIGFDRMSELAARTGKHISIDQEAGEGDGTGASSGIPEAETGSVEGFGDSESGEPESEDEG